MYVCERPYCWLNGPFSLVLSCGARALEAEFLYRNTQWVTAEIQFSKLHEECLVTRACI